MPDDLNSCPDCGNSELWEPTEASGNFCETWRCSQCKRPVPEGEELEAKRWVAYYTAAAGTVPALFGG